MQHWIRSTALTAAAAAAAACLSPAARAQQQEPLAGADKVDFVEQIQPILEDRCYRCHGPKKQEAEIRFDLKSVVFGADKDLWSILPGEPEDSPLYERITLPKDDPDVMPNEGDTLTAEQIALIRRWIEEGASWPDGLDQAVLAAEQRRREREVIAVRELGEAEQAAEAAALDSLHARGALAMQIANNTAAKEVNFSLLGDVTDDDLQALDGLEGTLVWLNLSRTGITDRALSRLEGCTALRRLNLAQTGIGDEGLVHVAPLAELRYLNLYGTRVTDAGLRHLHQLARLEKLFLWQTGVTDAGAAELAAALPHLQIDLGDYAELLAAEPVAAAADAKAPVNEKCPVSGKAVSADATTVHDGQTIAFCCEKCLAKFEADPARFLDKVDGLKPKAPAPAAAVAVSKAPVNQKCPVSGKAVSADATTVHDGQTIAFCCEKCLAKFEADPARFLDKVDGLQKVKQKAP